MINRVSEWVSEWTSSFQKSAHYINCIKSFFPGVLVKTKAHRLLEISQMLIRFWPNVCEHPNTKAICTLWTFNFKSISINMDLVFPNSFDSSGKLSTRCCSIAVGIYSHSDTRASVRSGTHARRWDLAHNHCSNSSQRLNGVQADSNF